MPLVTTVVLLFSLSYTVSVFLVSRRRRPEPLPAPDNLFFVVVVPCLNEELVIGRSLERLLAVGGGHNLAVLVVDDGSEDRTADVVREYADERVWLLQRTLPEARQGKGAALNAAYQHLLSSDLLAGRRPEDVVMVILDADGRLEGNALFEVAPFFRDPRVGAVQIGVRMYNADASLLARMQDFEFVTFTEIFQRARQRLGSVGLGGNGQFTRLTALQSLGEAPWTSCLTEDLDLGVRLLVGGWLNRYCPTTHVSQQAVTSVRRLLRQRARWFQGHLQCWARIPLVMRSSLSGRSSFDLVYHLTGPGLVLVTSFPMLLFVFSLIAATFATPESVAASLVANGGTLLGLWYLLSFGLAPFYGFVYWLRDRSTSLPRALLLAHLFSLYAYLWFPAGWIAVAKVTRGQRGWAKTARTVDADARISAAVS